MLFVSTEFKDKPQRPNKGKSVIALPQVYTVIDIETTGLDPCYCEIIEISALRYSGNNLIESFSSLVKPEYPIDDFITQLTGITNQMVMNAPDIETVAKLFYDFIGNDILVGYNVNFDINFLYDVLYDKCGLSLKNSFIDVMRFARKLLPDLKNHKLCTVAKYYGEISFISHRSYADCETTNACFQHLINDAIKIFGDFETFSNSFKHKHSKLRACEISATKEEFDINHPLYNKVCVFTGVLEKMQRKEAMQLVANVGGKCGDSVTSKTNYLILGNNDFCSSIKDGKSSKQKKAENMILQGKDIQIISENVFYDLVLEQ